MDSHQSTRAKSATVVARGLLWVGSAGALNLLARLAVMTVLARLLTPAEYGIVAAAMTLLLLVNVIGEVGLRPAIVQRSDLTSLHVRTAFTASLVTAVALAVAVALLAGAVEGFFRIPGLAEIVHVLAAVVFLQLLALVPRALLSRHMQFRRLSMVDALSYMIGYGLVAVGLAALGLGHWSLAMGVLIQTALSATAVVILRRKDLGWGFSLRALLDLAATGVGFSITSTFNLLANHVDNVIVARFLGGHALGIYGRAYQLMALPVGVLTQVLDYVLFPAMAKQQEQTDRLAVSLQNNIAVTALLGVPATVLMALLAPELVYVVFGKRWLEVAPVLQVLAWGNLLRVGYKFPSLMLFAMGRSRATAAIQFAYFATVAIGSWMAATHGLIAVAYAVLAGLAVSTVATVVVTSRAVDLSWNRIVRAVLPGLLTGLLVGALVLVTLEWVRPLTPPPFTLVVVAAVLAGAGLTLLWRPVRSFLIGAENLRLINALRTGMAARRERQPASLQDGADAR